MEDHKLTVIVCVYNEEAYLESMFSNILQNYEYIDKILVSDNCSTDNSCVICEKYVSQYDKISFISHSHHMRALQHFFWGIRQVNTEYVLFWRPKNILSKDFVKICMNELNKNPDAVASFSDIYYSYLEDRREDNRNYIPGCYFPTETLKEFSSRNLRDRIIAVIENSVVNNIIYQICKTEVLLYAIAHSEFEESAADCIIGLRLAIMGRILNVKGATYFYYTRRETKEELFQRYKRNGFYVDEDNPYWYLPAETWKICKLLTPEIFDKKLQQTIILAWRYRFGAEMREEDWKLRHTEGKLVEYIQGVSSNKQIVLFGTGEYAKKVYLKIKDRLAVAFFVDNNKEKHHKSFMEKEIKPPAELKRTNKFVVCVASEKFAYEIIKQMIGYGYEYFDNLFSLAKAIPLDKL